MRRTMLKKLAVLSAMAVMTVAPAFAQDRLDAKIPFAFNVGSRSLPAGDYEVRKLGVKTMVIQNVATGRAAIAVINMTVPPKESSSKAALVFHQYGDSCFFSGTRTAENERTVIPSKLERQVARETAENAPVRDVYLAANVR